jgi:hypothetical protein
MPFIRSSVFKHLAYYSKLIAVILLFNKVMPSCSYYKEKRLVYITLIVPSNCQPSFYFKCIILNMHLSYNI